MGVSPKRRKVFILLTVSNPKVFNVLKNIIWKAWLLLGTIQYILEVTRDGELLVLSEDWKAVALECLTQPSRTLGTSPRLGLRRPGFRETPPFHCFEQTTVGSQRRWSWGVYFSQANKHPAIPTTTPPPQHAHLLGWAVVIRTPESWAFRAPQKARKATM